jgi:transposase-like protein
MCSCEEAEFLGRLGHLAHYRCRDCGITYSLEVHDAFDFFMEV